MNGTSTESASVTHSLRDLNVSGVGPFDSLSSAAIGGNETQDSLYLQLAGDVFEVRCWPCAEFSGMGPNTRPYVGNISMIILNSTTALLQFARVAGFTVPSAESVEVSIRPCCLHNNKESHTVNVTIVPPKKVRRTFVGEVVLEISKTAGIVASVLGGMTIAPSIATTNARTFAILAIAACDGEFEELEFMQSPTGATIGNGDLKYLAGGAVANMLIFTLIVTVMLTAAFFKSVSLREGLTWVRCPSLLALPIGLFLDPTTMCCTALLTPRATPRRLLLALCSTPSAFLRLFKCSAIFDAGSEPRWWLVMMQIRHGRCFLVARPSGRDQENCEGYCRRNRMLFCDYRESRRLFFTAEVLMSVASGTINGLVYGGDECEAITIAFLICILIFLSAVVFLHPHNVPLGFWFSVVSTAGQAVTLVLLALDKFYSTPCTFAAAEILSLLLLYLSVINVMIGLAPKLFDLCQVEAAPEASSQLEEPLLTAPCEPVPDVNNESPSAGTAVTERKAPGKTQRERRVPQQPDPQDRVDHETMMAQPSWKNYLRAYQKLMVFGESARLPRLLPDNDLAMYFGEASSRRRTGKDEDADEWTKLFREWMKARDKLKKNRQRQPPVVDIAALSRSWEDISGISISFVNDKLSSTNSPEKKSASLT